MDPDNADVLCDRAELHINEQKYEEAIQDYQRASQIENHPKKVGLSSSLQLHAAVLGELYVRLYSKC